MKRAATICALVIVAGVLLRNVPILGDIFAVGALCGASLLVALPFIALDFKAHENETKGIDL